MQLLRPASVSVRATAVLFGLAASAVAFAWIALTVHYTYQDRWTAMFQTGTTFHPPAALAGENIYLFPGPGFDGQMYHYIAHDPFIRRDFLRSLDDPRFRYRRILVPLAAWTLALGRDPSIHAAYFAVILGSLFAGVYWLAMLAAAYGRAPALGLLFLISPAAIISIDRMTVDIATAALTLAAIYYFHQRRQLKLWFSLAAACLSRENAALLSVALIGFSYWRDRRFRLLLLLASSLLPALLWNLYAAGLTPPSKAAAGSIIPFGSLIGLIFHPFDYKLPATLRLVAQSGDLLCLAGLTLCVFLAAARWRRLLDSAAGWAILASVLMMAFIGLRPMWTEPYNYGRIFTPLLLLVAVEGFGRRGLAPLVPLLLFLPRIVLQLGPQLLAVAGGLAKSLRLALPAGS